jgi:hypothetical protein
MRKLRVAPLILALTIGACHDAPTVISTARIRVSQVSDGIRLENLTDRGMGYLLINQKVLPLYDWGPCESTTPDCLRLPAHGAVTVKFADIVAYSTSTKSVVVYTWWVVDNGTGGMSADLDTPATLELQ